MTDVTGRAENIKGWRNDRRTPAGARVKWRPREKGALVWVDLARCSGTKELEGVLQGVLGSSVEVGGGKDSIGRSRQDLGVGTRGAGVEWPASPGWN